MKAFIIITVARQVYGEYVFVRTEKAFSDGDKANAYLGELRKTFTANGNWTPVAIDTPTGRVQCQCEAAVHEIDIE